MNSLVSSPRTQLVAGNRLSENFESFKSLPNESQFSMLCVSASSWKRQEIFLKQDQARKTGSKSPSSMSREHTFSKEPPCQNFCRNSKNQNLTSVQVHVVQVMGTHGLEIAIPSGRDHSTTSWVLVSRGKDRFVDELRTPNVSRNVPSSESLSEQATSKENEPCVVTETRSRELEAILLV